MAAFGISYLTMMSYMWPLMVGCFAVILFYLFVILKEEDVSIIPAELKPDRVDGVPDPTHLVDWSLIILLSVIIVLSNFAREYTEEVQEFVATSGLGILDFMKRTSYVRLNQKSSDNLSNKVAKMASIENLDGHKLSVTIRQTEKK